MQVKQLFIKLLKMKRFLIGIFYSVLILGGVFAFGMTTGNVVFASVLTGGILAFSVAYHAGAFGQNLALEAPVLPDFKYKSLKDIEALSDEDKDTYFKERQEFEKAERALELYNATEKIKADMAEKSEAEIKEALDKVNKESAAKIREIEDAYLSLKASMEGKKDGDNAEKTDLIKFITRNEGKETKELKEKGGWATFKFKAKALISRIASKAPALMTTSNVVNNVTDGFNQLFGNYIDPEIHSAPKRDAFILNEVDVASAPGTDAIWYVQRVNEEGDAAFIGEGDAKPLADAEYQEYKADVKEVAIFWKMSERLMNHAPSVVNDFRTHADELIELEIDDGVLSGDGTGNNLEGITTAASPFVVPSELANYYTFVNIHDVIMAVATYVRLNNFKGELVCILNTVWKAKMMGIKNTDGDYIIPPFVTRDGKQVGETRVRFENGLVDTHILLGDLKKFKVRISENVTYAEGWENDDFRKNLVSRRMAAWMGTYLPSNYDGSIIYDEISVIEAAIADTSS